MGKLNMKAGLEEGYDVEEDEMAEELPEDDEEAEDQEPKCPRDIILELYIADVTRYPRLTAKDEKTLASEIEEAKYLERIEESYFQRHDTYPSSVRIVIYLLHHLVSAKRLVDALAKELKLPATKSFAKRLSDPKLRSAIDSVIDPELVETVANATGKSIPETEQGIIELSIRSRLLPHEVTSIIEEKATWEEAESLITEPVDSKFLSHLQAISPQL
ncbi:MAG: hypothetical protein FJ024_03630, partial [Chloroflexi bacterium]|nr:hypothetical protein [Chloroflexota bacterium]